MESPQFKRGALFIIYDEWGGFFDHVRPPRNRERDISETLLRRWHEQFLAGGAEKLAGRTERSELDELRRRNARLERTWDSRRWNLRSRGNS